jgi:hypothetical protein
MSAKAISQTHNAQQFTRMSFDIMTLGYVTGKIGAAISRQGIETRAFDVRSIQNELYDLRILPSVKAKKSAAQSSDKDIISQHINELLESGENSLLRIMMDSMEKVEPQLRKAFDLTKNETQKLCVAKALAWFGNSIGNTHILREMNVLFQEEQVSGVLPWEYYREDQDTNYWLINQDIALLGLSGDPSVLDDILTIADSLPLGNPPAKQRTVYNQGRIDLRLIPFYNRIINICFAIELMPHQKAIAALKRFLDDPYIRGQVTKTPQFAGERVYGGILESRLAATLARCGDKRGFEILIEYLDDLHPILAQYAKEELKSILGRDLQYDRQKWLDYIGSITFPLQSVPNALEKIEV